MPEWQFRSPDAQIGLGDYITMKHPTFWIKGIPVFYVPFFIVPIKDKRTTGFLPPRFGGSDQFGASVGDEFFWAMTDWLDSTIGLDYLSKGGVMPSVEMRYAIDPASDGQLQAAFLHDRQTNQDLYRVLLQQRQDFGWGIRGLSQLDMRSQTDLVRRFSLAIGVRIRLPAPSSLAIERSASPWTVRAVRSSTWLRVAGTPSGSGRPSRPTRARKAVI